MTLKERVELAMKQESGQKSVYLGLDANVAEGIKKGPVAKRPAAATAMFSKDGPPQDVSKKRGRVGAESPKQKSRKARRAKIESSSEESLGEEWSASSDNEEL